MDEDQLESMMNVYVPHMVTEDGKLDIRTVRLLCQEIERETRGKSVEAMFAVANAVNHRQDVRRMLRAV